MALRNNEGFQALRIVYTGGFVDYLLGEVTNCNWIQMLPLWSVVFVTTKSANYSAEL